MSADGVDTVSAPHAWHGPASLVGVMLGLLVEALPFVLSSDELFWPLLLLPPVLGLVLLAAPQLRRLGIGLVASALAYPIVVATYVLTALSG